MPDVVRVRFDVPVIWVRVYSVYDGDTFWVDHDLDGQKDITVRLIGIDTPEFRPAQCYGLEATYRARELIDGQMVALERDVSDVDSWGRWLRYVYLSNRTWLNGLLVREGCAKAAAYPPDARYSAALRLLQDDAMIAGAGGWTHRGWRYVR